MTIVRPALRLGEFGTQPGIARIAAARMAHSHPDLRDLSQDPDRFLKTPLTSGPQEHLECSGLSGPIKRGDGILERMDRFDQAGYYHASFGERLYRGLKTPTS